MIIGNQKSQIWTLSMLSSEERCMRRDWPRVISSNEIARHSRQKRGDTRLVLAGPERCSWIAHGLFGAVRTNAR